MSKILITGNGFDLFHHLPTKYHHFISIMEIIEKNYYAIDVSFDELFGGFFRTKHQVEYDLILENYNVKNIVFNQSKLNRINELLRTNLWYKHFKNVTGIDTWIDFETEVEGLLSQLSFLNKFENKSDIKRNMLLDEFIYFTDFELFDLIQIINKSGGFKINEKYINNRKSSIDLESMLCDLARSFEELIVIFNRYLVDIVSVFYSETKNTHSIPFHLMDEIYTFNYTPTIEMFYCVHKSKVVYLHGEINEDCKKQNLVLGISDISDEIKINKAYDFTKYYQKIKKNCNKNFITLPLKSHAYDKETFFYVIGHSLDISDKKYILDLFVFLEQDVLNKSKIFIFYYDDKDRDGKIRNLLSIIEEKTVSKLHRENRLCFVELNNHNLDLEFNKIEYQHKVHF